MEMDIQKIRKIFKPRGKIKYCQRRRLMMRNSEEKDSACTSDMIETKQSDDDEILKESNPFNFYQTPTSETTLGSPALDTTRRSSAYCSRPSSAR